MAKPLVTVLIDTYNHESFIEDAVNSVIAQEFPASDMEILVVDDGSADRTAEVVHRFEPRVRLLRKGNGGQASAFNTGILEAQGDIVAFLDGDDWWAPEKLTRVVGAFIREPSVGLVGHGIMHVRGGKLEDSDMLKAEAHFRINSVDAARTFRARKQFLGTSRMAYRRKTLRKIGPVPEVLKFEADEYLFTLAGLYADVMILRDVLTFYRIHDKNLFQLSNGDPQGTRRKQQILMALADSLDKKFKEHRVSDEIAKCVLECVRVEADVLRLALDKGYPWETILTEMEVLRVLHSDASFGQKTFSLVRLLPALAMPSNTYYRWRYRLSRLSFYKNLRNRFLPFPQASHVERQETKPPPDCNGNKRNN